MHNWRLVNKPIAANNKSIDSPFALAHTHKFIVEYKELAYGAQLTFSSKESEVIDAIHKWFEAQLKDHGTDAKSSLN